MVNQDLLTVNLLYNDLLVPIFANLYLFFTTTVDGH